MAGNFVKKYTELVEWLLEGDPSIRYQTLRDLKRAESKIVNTEQQKILQEGWGKRFMDLQQDNGTWSNALYSPKWTSTFYTLLTLKTFGAPVDKSVTKACAVLIDKGFYDPDGGINYWKSWKQGESCVTGMLLSMLCYFEYDDERIHRLANFLLADQMPDKGWNCERLKGATHSSFHTTISVLEGLWEYEKRFPDSSVTEEIKMKKKEGVEFLLQHHLYKSNTTWEVIDPRMIKLSFPPRWHYDIMRCLDFFQELNIGRDERMLEAVGLLKKKQTAEGHWKLEHKFPAKNFFEFEKVGKPSRWNTLRALRILKWWEGGVLV